MTNRLIDPDNCRRAFGVMLTRGRALVLVRSAAELQDAFSDLLLAAEDLRVPLDTSWDRSRVEITIADGVPKDHAGRIEIVVRRNDGALRGRIAHLILHPFNVAPSEAYPVIATTGGDVRRYDPLTAQPAPAADEPCPARTGGKITGVLDLNGREFGADWGGPYMANSASTAEILAAAGASLRNVRARY